MTELETISSNLDLEEAKKIQTKIASSIQIQPFTSELKYLAGCDISFNLDSKTVYGGITVLNFPTLTIHSYALATMKTTFPYIPGFLSFREIPVLLAAWEKLTLKPDLIVADGQGIAHPRKCGIASHLGYLLDIPTIGCAKSVLVGKYTEPSSERGSWSNLIYKNEVIGTALRTKNNTKPVFVSPGYKTDLNSALEIILNSTNGFKIPEPTRRLMLLEWARLLSKWFSTRSPKTYILFFGFSFEFVK